MAGFMRLTRSAMLEVLDSEYVKFARIKGLAEQLVIFKHALKNAVIPVLTFGGISFAGLLNGSIVVEVIFSWPGLGLLMLEGHPNPRRSDHRGHDPDLPASCTS